ncbi:MAG: hypothetical protein IPH09_13620 [bacterium]|nr:hypothetical protein [bacterium]
MMRTIRVTVVAVFLVMLVGVAAAADYWPLTPGTTFTYQWSDGPLNVEILQNSNPAWFSRSYTSAECAGSGTYRLNDDGDVLWGGSVWSCKSWVDPDFFTLTPPVLFLDLPLTVGKQWQSQTTVDYGYGSFAATLHCSVTGTETVTTPAGDFETMVMQMITFDGPWFLRQWTYKLHRQLGPVIDEGGELVAWTGVVSSDESTWGEVKALYAR